MLNNDLSNKWFPLFLDIVVKTEALSEVLKIPGTMCQENNGGKNPTGKGSPILEVGSTLFCLSVVGYDLCLIIVKK